MELEALAAAASVPVVAWWLFSIFALLTYIQNRYRALWQQAPEVTIKSHQMTAQQSYGSGDPGIGDVIGGQFFAAAERGEQRPLATQLRHFNTGNGEQGVDEGGGVPGRSGVLEDFRMGTEPKKAG